VLHRELDRSERVLDLVRDATRHLRPRGEAARADDLGDVLEDDDAPRKRPCSGVKGRNTARRRRSSAPPSSSRPRPRDRRAAISRARGGAARGSGAGPGDRAGNPRAPAPIPAG
jgi:hypothetical protein